MRRRGGGARLRGEVADTGAWGPVAAYPTRHAFAWLGMRVP